ncbi:MAG: DNA repair protein RecO [Chlamydiia bacterium]
MTEKKLQAIVLKAIPFKDNQSILTLLSEEKGMVSMIVKGLSKKKPQLLACINPLSEVEFLYLEGRSDLLVCHEASMIHAHLFLRDTYPFLEMGTTLLKVLLDSQYPSTSSPHLYHLLSSYLKQIPSFEKALPNLLASFLIKLIKHEGLLLIQPSCTVCGRNTDMHLFYGDFFCSTHTSHPSVSFSDHEWRVLQALGAVRSFQILQELTVSLPLLDKIKMYFTSQIQSL